MSSATATAAMPESRESEMKTYWCHECDMSVALSSPSSSNSGLVCPHCHTHFLELMDSPPQSSDSLHHFLLDLQYDDVFQDPIFPPSSSHSLPTITVTSSLLSQLDPCGGVIVCAVCKDPIGVDSQAKQLPCDHLYHSDCITPWLELHSSCPLCRFQLVGEKEEEEGVSEARRIRGQLRMAMMRLSELMEEEEDFYGLRTTLSHIASRHRLLLSSSDVLGGGNAHNPSHDDALPGSVPARLNADLESLPT